LKVALLLSIFIAMLFKILIVESSPKGGGGALGGVGVAYIKNCWMHQERLTEGGRLSTFNLLIKVACFVNKVIKIFII
jgi:hypothetical protein